MPLQFRLPRPRKRLRTWLLAATFAGVGLAGIGADRLTAVWIERQTAAAFQSATGTAGTPSARVSGFPILSQVLSGRLNHVDLTAAEIPATDLHPVAITSLHMAMDGVRAYDQSRSATAEIVHASAFLSYADLSRSLGLAIAADSQAGRVDATAVVPLLGEVAVSFRVSVAGADSIAFEDPQVKGDLPPGAATAITKALKQPVELKALPRGLSLVGVTSDGSGVHAQLAGSGVTFTTYADTGATS